MGDRMFHLGTPCSPHPSDPCPSSNHHLSASLSIPFYVGLKRVDLKGRGYQKANSFLPVFFSRPQLTRQRSTRVKNVRMLKKILMVSIEGSQRVIQRGSGLAWEKGKTLRRDQKKRATAPRSVKESEVCGIDWLGSGNALLRAHRGSLAGLQLHDDALVEVRLHLVLPSPNLKWNKAPCFGPGQVARGFVRPQIPVVGRPKRT